MPEYSKKALDDFSLLFIDFVQFFLIDLPEAIRQLPPSNAEKLKELINPPLKRKQFLTLFQHLLLRSQTPYTLLGRDFLSLLDQLYHYLNYAEPLLKKHFKEKYDKDFLVLKNKYRAFYVKHLGRLP